MDVKCIKDKKAHWGSIFTEGKWYIIAKTSTVKRELVLDYEKYYHYTGLIASSITWVRKGYEEKDLPSVIPGYLTYKQVHEKYAKYIEIPSYSIPCDDSGEFYQFCSITKRELIDTYGSCKFSTTEKFFEDYFITKEDIRNDKLGGILK